MKSLISEVKTYEIDWAGAKNDDKNKIAGVLNKYKLTIVDFKPNGPGGGWPVIKFKGDPNNALKFFNKEYGEDARSTSDISHYEV